MALLATGTMVESSRRAMGLLEEAGIDASLVNARFVKPMDVTALAEIAERHDLIVTVEENAIDGGFGSVVASYLGDQLRPGQKVVNLGLPDRFIEHGPRKMLLEEVGLSPEGLATTVRRHWEQVGEKA